MKPNYDLSKNEEKRQYTNPRCLTLQQASLETGMGIWSLRRAIYSRKLACVKPGGAKGRVFILREDLEAFLKRFRYQAVAERFK